MGQELEASANGFLGEFFLQRVAFSKDLMKFLPGGVQIVRTKNQNIPDVSFPQFSFLYRVLSKSLTSQVTFESDEELDPEEAARVAQMQQRQAEAVKKFELEEVKREEEKKRRRRQPPSAEEEMLDAEMRERARLAARKKLEEEEEERRKEMERAAQAREAVLEKRRRMQVDF